MIALMGGAVYFLMIRPQQKRAKETANLMSSLEPGSRVMTISGIVGTIKYLGDKQAILEVSPGVEITMDKRALSTQPVVDEFEYADDAEPQLIDGEPRPSPVRSRPPRSSSPPRQPRPTSPSTSPPTGPPGTPRRPPRTEHHKAKVATTSRKHSHPLRTLVILALVIAGLYGLIAISGVWTPEARPRPSRRQHDHADRVELHRDRHGRPGEPRTGPHDHPAAGGRLRRR